MSNDETKPPEEPARAKGRWCYCRERPAALAVANGKLPLCMPRYESFVRANDIQQRASERLLNNLAG